MNHERTGETMTKNGVMLHQIRCIRAIEHLGVKVGDIGGWIEKESNLSGGAWVADNAMVFGDAVISGAVVVRGDAMVHSGAWIYGGRWDKSPLYREYKDDDNERFQD